MIIASGGMSVDPDDRTPAAIRAAGGEVVTYGSPTFPGAMFMLSYVGDVPVIGLPGCAMYHKATVFELIVPRILAGDRITRADIIALGHGGFCASCRRMPLPELQFRQGIKKYVCHSTFPHPRLLHRQGEGPFCEVKKRTQSFHPPHPCPLHRRYEGPFFHPV